MKPCSINTYHKFFTNLANQLKIKIISCLREGKKNVSEIADELGMEQSKISHALSSLKNCNIVDVEQEGKQRIYFLNEKTIIPMLDLIDKHAKIFCKGRCVCMEGK